MVSLKCSNRCSHKSASPCPDSGHSAVEILLCLAFAGITMSYTGSIALEQIEKRSLYSFSSKLFQGINGAFETAQYRGTEISILKKEAQNSFLITSKGNPLLVVDYDQRHLKQTGIYSSIRNREEIKIHPNGYCTPGRIELVSKIFLCVIRISIRGRVTNSCSKK
jgi:hypothetical protein